MLPNVKPVAAGAPAGGPNRLPGAAAGVDDEAGAEVPGALLLPKLNDMIDDVARGFDGRRE